jgi:XTP/dITP diphosphohydrolase
MTITLKLLTSNRDKVTEANIALRGSGVRVTASVCAGKLELQSDTLEEVASYAAVQGYAWLHEAVLAEDSGFFVSSLKGFPGVYSRYVFDTLGVNGLLKLVGDSVDRKAEFRSCVAYYDGRVLRTFSASVQGVILTRPSGSSGFGFDPIFAPSASRKISFADMTTAEKTRISHRGEAFRRLGEWARANL